MNTQYFMLQGYYTYMIWHIVTQFSLQNIIIS